MAADRFLSIFLFCCIAVLMLFGCVPEKTEAVLTKYNYLSSWMQAVGSLAAVWATYYIFRLNSEENEKRDRKKEEKLKQEAESLEKEIAERKKLSARVDFLSDVELGEFISHTSFLVENYQMNIASINSTEISDVDYAFELSMTLFGNSIRPLNNELLKKIAYLFDGSAIRLQMSLIKLKGCVDSIINIIESYNKFKIYYEIEFKKEPEEEEIKSFKINFDSNIKIFISEMDALKKEFAIISEYSKF